MKTTTTILLLAMTAAARPFVPILARMPARLPTEFYARDADVALPELAAQAQAINTEFDGLRLADACTSGEKACVQGTSATCVGGKWDGDDCPNGMRCFALPDLSQGAVVLTCTSKTDAKSRIDAAAQAGPAMEEAVDATATADGECPDETDTGAAAPASTDDGPAPTSTAAPAGAGGADDGDDEDCPAENDSDNNAGNDNGADGADDSCEDDTVTDTDAPATPTVVPPASSTGLPIATAGPASPTDAPTSTDLPIDTAPTTDAPLPTTTDAPLPTTTPAPEPEPIETVTSVVIILPAQTLGGSATTTTLTPAEASAVLSSLGLSGLHTSTTLVQPSQTQVGAPDATSDAPAATQTVDGGAYGGDYPESGSASVTTTSSAPTSTATDGDFITPILPGASSEPDAAPPAVTIV